jgi:transposase
VADDYNAVLRLLADRHRDLTALRTQAVCRLHTLLCLLIAGGAPRGLTYESARAALGELRGLGLVDLERKAQALELLADLGRLDDQLARLKARIGLAVETAGTTVTEVYGVGPICAAIILGYVGDIARFPTAGHFARYNATAPIDASSGPQARQRLNPAGTASSTTPCTWPPSARSATTPQAGLTTSASRPRARPAKKPSAPSRDASATPSTGGRLVADARRR